MSICSYLYPELQTESHDLHPKPSNCPKLKLKPCRRLGLREWISTSDYALVSPFCWYFREETEFMGLFFYICV